MSPLFVNVVIDRSIGYNHNGLIYEVNYGYVPKIIADDNEEQDTYILDSEINLPINNYYGQIIAIVKREDDVEDKWIVSNEKWTEQQIYDKIFFVEKYFQSKVYLIENFDSKEIDIIKSKINLAKNKEEI